MSYRLLIKTLTVLFIAMLMFGCGKRVDMAMPEQNSLDAKEAIEVLRSTVDKYSKVPHMWYKEMMTSTDSTRLVHVWETDKNRSYYVRYWSFDGTDLRVEFQRNEASTEYYVALKNNGRDPGDCYGYTHSMPVAKGMRFDIYWSDFGNQGCKSVIRYTFESKEEAVLFAGALQYLFIDHKMYDILHDMDYEKEDVVGTGDDKKTDDVIEEKSGDKEMETKSESKTPEVNKNSCGVEKILKMQEIGLSIEEIKRICQ